ncbi:hypothetical protein [Selenomonas ruminantium]|uniref:hypothetical protein n=1 Tax=Selenomonas ruminantium TaxID=971 RepID=UPI0026F237DF|nr:hypothetical protein [Selenomonas ruminantium]
MSAMSDEILKGIEKREMIMPNTMDITADTDWWGIKFTKAIYEFTATGTTTVHFSTMDIIMIVLLICGICTATYLLIKAIVKKQSVQSPPLSEVKGKDIFKNKISDNKVTIALSVLLVILFSFSYHQDQEIKQLKQEVAYQKSRVDVQKILTDMAEEKCERLATQLDEAQTPVQVIYSAPQTNPFTQYQQDQAYTDMLNKINRNLDQQYYDSVLK